MPWLVCFVLSFIGSILGSIIEIRYRPINRLFAHFSK